MAERAVMLARGLSVCAVAIATCGAVSLGCDRNKATPTPAPPAPTASASASIAAPSSSAPKMPMNALPIPSADVYRLVNPDKLPAYHGPTGSVEGTITVTGDPAPPSSASFTKCPDGSATYGHTFRAGATAPGGRAQLLGDAIVVVTGYTGFYLPEKQEARVLAARDCAFETRTVTMTFGQRLEVRNRTKDVLSPILTPSPRPVVMIAIPGGDPVKLYLPKPGRYLLSTREHPWMTADIYTFMHPLHTSSRSDGSYRIDGVPVGKLQVGAAHPSFPAAASKDVEILAGVVAKVDITLRYAKPDASAAPEASADAGPWYPKLR